jgi:hypothetical protein
VKNDVSFGIDACCGMAWRLFDGAVDLFILEAFIDESSVACNSRVGVPAINVSVKWVCGVREEVHGGLADTFGNGSDGTVVGADVVALPGE